LAIDESTRQILGEDTKPEGVFPALEASLKRLQRDRIDVMLLHLNTLSVEKANELFVELDKAVQSGKLRAYGWSTDFPASVEDVVRSPSFQFIEHGMNVMMDVPTIQSTVRKYNLTALIRSPLAMGVLTGKYRANDVQPDNDIRSTNAHWMEYFDKGRPSARYLDNLNRLQELLTVDGRTLGQGALCWLMAKAPYNLPVPGARTVEQVQENAGAIEFGPLSDAVMQEIENLIVREPEGEPRER
jgi:aryl-alcohol dehydrogenase-like predicted oxidoreductase